MSFETLLGQVPWKLLRSIWSSLPIPCIIVMFNCRLSADSKRHVFQSLLSVHHPLKGINLTYPVHLLFMPIVFIIFIPCHTSLWTAFGRIPQRFFVFLCFQLHSSIWVLLFWLLLPSSSYERFWSVFEYLSSGPSSGWCLRRFWHTEDGHGITLNWKATLPPLRSIQLKTVQEHYRLIRRWNCWKQWISLRMPSQRICIWRNIPHLSLWNRKVC